MHCTRWSPYVSFEASQVDVACMAMFILAMLLDAGMRNRNQEGPGSNPL